MKKYMKLSVISSTILLATLPTAATFAAGLDRSGQSMSAFLQPGNYAEAGMSFLNPSVKGQSTSKGLEGEQIDNMGQDYYFPSAAIKVQATDHISLGLLYDQPFGADAEYSNAAGTFGDGLKGTKVEVRTNNLTALIGFQPTDHWNFYGGAVWQTVEADISLHGAAYSLLNGYKVKVKNEDAYGWLAGFAYQIPDIALRAAVTYRSEIEHNARSVESTNLPYPGLDYAEGTVQAVTPQSVNFDF